MTNAERDPEPWILSMMTRQNDDWRRPPQLVDGLRSAATFLRAGSFLSLPKLDAFLMESGLALGQADLSNVPVEDLQESLKSVGEMIAVRFARADRSYPGMLMFWEVARGPETRTGARAVEEAMVRATGPQLASDNIYVHEAALHGLGHVGTPASRAMIKAFLKANRDSPLRPYAQAALRGRVL